MKLSFCIATRNRASLIGLTIESILKQVTDECEIVVVDGASTDETPNVMRQLVQRHNNVRYFKQQVNGGVDRDFDLAVELAHGEYCWLVPDDDILISGAISSVLTALLKRPGLVLVNVEHRDASTWGVLSSSMLRTSCDQWLSSGSLTELFDNTFDLVTYIGCVVVLRKMWVSRERNRYYGSEFIHIGVIFQSPIEDGIYIIATPLISIRCGNQQWLPRSFDVWMVNLPNLVMSLPLSASKKRNAIVGIKTWPFILQLLYFRAVCAYSTLEYCKYLQLRTLRPFTRYLAYLVAILPCGIANAGCVVLSLFQSSRSRKFSLAFLRRSPACCGWLKISDADRDNNHIGVSE
jgi:abequosyltransferase